MNIKIVIPAICLIVAALCSGCYRDLLPTGPVVDEETVNAPPQTSGVTYTSTEPRTDYPIMPFKTWSMKIVDEVLTEVEGHERWWMLEVCQAELEDGSRRWFTIDTELDGTQFLGISDPVIRPMADIFPAEKYDNKLTVKVRDFVDRRIYVIKYVLPDGTDVYLEVQTPLEIEPPSERNGNAMSHSANISMVLIDLAGLGHGSAKIKFNNELQRSRTLLGVYERTWRISQTAGGIAIGDVGLSADYATGTLNITRGGVKVAYKPFDNPRYLRFRGESIAASEEIVFLKNGRALELARVTFKQADVAIFDLRFNPALPDLRYTIEEEYKTNVYAGINGRAGYMYGDAIVTSVVGGYKVLIRPHEPHWAHARPIEVSIIFNTDKTVSIFNRLAPELAFDGEEEKTQEEEESEEEAEEE
jgi:hypothetical protein